MYTLLIYIYSVPNTLKEIELESTLSVPYRLREIQLQIHFRCHIRLKKYNLKSSLYGVSAAQQ
jgi:hypothetical protein